MMRLLSRISLITLLGATLACAAQDAPVYAPNENLIVDGIPAVPMSIVERARVYREFRSAAFQSWHPQRREMLIGTRFGSTNQIHAVAMPGGARTQLTFLADRVLAARFQPGAGRYFLFSHDTGGGEWFQISRYDLDSGQISLLTDGSSRNQMNALSDDGKHLAFTSTRRNRKDNDLYVMDPMDPKSTRMVLELSGGGWGASDWSPDGSRLVLQEYLSVNESYLWLVDVAAGSRKLLTPKGGPAVSYSDAAFSADGRGLYLSTDKDFEFKRFAYMDLETGNLTYLTSDIPWDADSVVLSPDRKQVVLETNEAGVSKLYLFDTRTRQRRPLAIPTGIVGRIEFRPGSQEIGFSLSSARTSSDAYSLDLKTGALQRWTTSETGGLRTENFPEPQLVRWKSFDGLEISGFLYLPPARFTGKRPVIVNIHGGPEGQSRPGFIGANNYYLNELGVAMLYPNVRGSTGFGKSFALADNAMNRDKTHKDIGALLDWIRSDPRLDSDRIMITGGSYGGYMTLAVATEYDAKIRCSKAVVPPSNLVTFLENTESYRRDLRRAEYGDERIPEVRAYLERTAPRAHAQNITKPIFLVQGKNDPRVPISEAEQMAQAVKKHNPSVWYLVGKNEGHGFQKKENQDYEFYATLLFVEKNLLP